MEGLATEGIAWVLATRFAVVGQARCPAVTTLWARVSIDRVPPPIDHFLGEIPVGVVCGVENGGEVGELIDRDVRAKRLFSFAERVPTEDEMPCGVADVLAG